MQSLYSKYVIHFYETFKYAVAQRSTPKEAIHSEMSLINFRAFLMAHDLIITPKSREFKVQSSE